MSIEPRYLIFELKTITYFNRKCRILCQNENGPCPLLAIANIMVLQNRLTFENHIEAIELQDLIQLIGNLFIESNNSNNIVDTALIVLPKLAYGLDLNVHFNEINSFEYTEELAVFDVLDIQLYHSWIIDEADDRLSIILTNKLSYNQLINKIVEYQLLLDNFNNLSNDDKSKLSSDENFLLALGPILQEFIDNNSSQMTYTGLTKLYDTINERQLSILFHNNHFSTLFKHDGKLYTLVTDIGFRDTQITWELLDEIDGNTVFTDNNFMIIHNYNNNNINATTIADQGTYANISNAPTEIENYQTLSDYEVAKRLQEEDDTIEAEIEPMDYRSYNSNSNPIYHSNYPSDPNSLTIPTDIPIDQRQVQEYEYWQANQNKSNKSSNNKKTDVCIVS